MTSSESATTRNDAGDLVSGRLPDLVGLSASIMADRLFRWVEATALTSSAWYLSEKVPKARKSRWLRVIAIIFAALGSVAPFVAVGFDDPKLAFIGYPILGAAAATIGADRALGLTSSWTRYQLAAATINKIVIIFQLRWAIVQIDLNAEPTANELSAALAVITEFAIALADAVLGETETWVNEFQSYMTRLQSEARLGN